MLVNFRLPGPLKVCVHLTREVTIRNPKLTVIPQGDMLPNRQVTGIAALHPSLHDSDHQVPIDLILIKAEARLVVASACRTDSKIRGTAALMTGDLLTLSGKDRGSMDSSSLLIPMGENSVKCTRQGKGHLVKPSRHLSGKMGLIGHLENPHGPCMVAMAALRANTHRKILSLHLPHHLTNPTLSRISNTSPAASPLVHRLPPLALRNLAARSPALILISDSLLCRLPAKGL